ncbi:MAG: Chemoreceptor glutamine deamidase CheD [Syntrophaceae bacterium PtaB.Bin038]|nr:MAG: Chemoreceptor glutamine deamidase CheD [Syntrophaceae bacterium PtaB.Bin038]
MPQILVKLADMTVSGNPEDLLVVYGLGSTAAVLLYDKETRVGGIAHFMLPSSTSEPRRALEYPAMYADVAIPRLVESCIGKGACRESLTARLAGGSILMGQGISRSISEGNIATARQVLEKLAIPLTAENTGGNHNRAVRMEIATGKTVVRRPDGGWEEMA